MVISKAIELFLIDRKARNCRPTTRRTYNKQLTNLAEFLRTKRISDTQKLSTQVISNYVCSRLDGGASPTTVFTERAVAVMFCDFLSDLGEAPELNWHKRIPSLRVDEKPPTCLSDKQCAGIVEAVEDMLYYREPFLRKRDLAIVLLLLDSGIRASEVLRLTLDDVSLDRQTVHVNEQSKSRRARDVWISKHTTSRMRSYLAARVKYNAQTDKLFITRLGKELKYTALYQMIVRAGNACGWHVSPHALRHSCCTSLINSGLAVTDAQAVMGHSNIRTTLRYVHLSNEDVKRRYLAVAPMDRLDK